MKTRKERTTKTARSAKRRTKTSALKGLLFPGQVIPLQVYGAWVSGDWAEVVEKSVYFSCTDGRVSQRSRDRHSAYDDRDLGPLPDGWDDATIFRHESKVDQHFVGPAAIIAKLKRLEKSRDGNDEEIGRLIHGGR